MELEELYQKIGGDLKNVMKRIPNEAMIGKFVRKYANDPTYNRLTAAVEAKNWKDAFRRSRRLGERVPRRPHPQGCRTEPRLRPPAKIGIRFNGGRAWRRSADGRIAF